MSSLRSHLHEMAGLSARSRCQKPLRGQRDRHCQQRCVVFLVLVLFLQLLRESAVRIDAASAKGEADVQLEAANANDL